MSYLLEAFGTAAVGGAVYAVYRYGNYGITAFFNLKARMEGKIQPDMRPEDLRVIEAADLEKTLYKEKKTYIYKQERTFNKAEFNQLKAALRRAGVYYANTAIRDYSAIGEPISKSSRAIRITGASRERLKNLLDRSL